MQKSGLRGRSWGISIIQPHHLSQPPPPQPPATLQARASGLPGGAVPPGQHRPTRLAGSHFAGHLHGTRRPVLAPFPELGASEAAAPRDRRTPEGAGEKERRQWQQQEPGPVKVREQLCKLKGGVVVDELGCSRQRAPSANR